MDDELAKIKAQLEKDRLKRKAEEMLKKVADDVHENVAEAVIQHVEESNAESALTEKTYETKTESFAEAQDDRPRKKKIAPNIIHFEINADNPERAKNFYEHVFGWRITKWAGPVRYWIIQTGDVDDPGIDGGLMKRMNPKAGTQNIVEVESIDEALRKVTDSGGKVVMSKKSIPGVGYHAYCEDTEGNVVGLMESDMGAE